MSFKDDVSQKSIEVFVASSLIRGIRVSDIDVTPSNWLREASSEPLSAVIDLCRQSSWIDWLTPRLAFQPGMRSVGPPRLG